MSAKWLESIVDPDLLKQTSERISKEILKHDDIEVIISIGVSGLLCGAISYITNMPLYVVRKSSRNTHSACLIETNKDMDDIAKSRDVVIAMVDDFVSTGSTVAMVNSRINSFNRNFKTRYELKYLFVYGCKHELGYHKGYYQNNIPESVQVIPAGKKCYL